MLRGPVAPSSPSFPSRCCSVTKGSGTRATSVFSHDEKKKKRRTMQPETGFSGFSNAWHLAHRARRNTSATDVPSLSHFRFFRQSMGLSLRVCSACLILSLRRRIPLSRANSLVFYRLTPMMLDELTTLMMSRRTVGLSLRLQPPRPRFTRHRVN